MPRPLPFNPPVSSTQALPVFVAGPTDAGIRAAYNAAVAVGGGIVSIPPRVITLLSPLPWSAGIVYQGTSWQPTQLPPSMGGSYAGTVLQGDGTFPAITYNSADQVSLPVNYAAFVNAMASGGGFEDLTFNNFTYGIKIGALYNPGCQYSRFHRLNFDQCSTASLYLENCQECSIDQINIIRPGTGSFYYVASGGSLDYVGNSYISNVVILFSSLTTRQIVFLARDDGSNTHPTQLNAITAYNLQAFHDGTLRESVQLASTTSGSASIGVIDSTKYPVNMPVTFDANPGGGNPVAVAYGVNENQIYFVVSSAANVIQVSDTQGGTAKLISASTHAETATIQNTLLNISVSGSIADYPFGSAVVLSASVGTAFTAGTKYYVVFNGTGVIRLSATYGGAAIVADADGSPTISNWLHVRGGGFPGLELVGLGSSIVQTNSFAGCDLEGSQSTCVLMQNCASVYVQTLFADTSLAYRTYTLRTASACRVDSRYQFTYDVDSSSQSSLIEGDANEIIPTVQTGTGLGGRTCNQVGGKAYKGSLMIYIGGANGPDIWLDPNTFALRESSKQENRVSYTSDHTILTGESGTHYDNIGAGSAVNFTLPTATSAMTGMKFGFYVGAAQTLKVTAPASTTIRIAGSVSMSAGNITNATIGGYVELTSVAANTYVAKFATGTWTVT